MAVIFVPNRPGQAELLLSPSGPVGRHLIKLGNKLERLAQHDVGVKTGALRASITSRLTVQSTGLVMTVGSANRVAYLHHEGTKPHVILPRRANALRFEMHGKIVIARKVNHPGTKANPYLSGNLARVVLSN